MRSRRRLRPPPSNTRDEPLLGQGRWLYGPLPGWSAGRRRARGCALPGRVGCRRCGDSHKPRPTSRFATLSCRPASASSGARSRSFWRTAGRSIPSRSTTISQPAATGAADGDPRAVRPHEVIETVMQSGLRGRGGAGYPTGLKWSTVAKAAGERKFVICNADEGDPGAFMDRSVLESDPHRVLEGMAHRRLCRRRRPRLCLCPRRISAGGQAAEACDPPGRAQGLARRRTSPVRPSASMSRSGSARVPLSAAKKRR